MKLGYLAHPRVIRFGLSHSDTDLGSHGKSIERIPAAAQADKVGTAVNRPPVIVLHPSLRAVVADREAIEHDLADAQRANVAQVFFQHQAIGGQFVRIKLLEESVNLICRRNNGLTLPRGTKRPFQSHGAALQHAFRRPSRITGAESRVARQRHLAHLLGESAGPTLRPLRVAADELVGDGLCLHERMWDDAAIKVLRATDAESFGLFFKEHVVRHEEERVGIGARSVVASPEVISLEFGEEPSVCVQQDLLIAAKPAAQA